MTSIEALGRPSDTREQDLSAQVLASVLEANSAVYLSAPITSGAKFVDWYLKHGRKLRVGSVEYYEHHRRSVIEPNIERIRAYARRLRREQGRQVIDPSGFEAAQWSQGEYRYFWGEVIKRYACEVIFMEGWEYSKGCVYELVVAMAEGIPTRYQDGRELGVFEARSKICLAVSNMKGMGAQADFNGRLLELVNQLTTQSTRPSVGAKFE